MITYFQGFKLDKWNLIYFPVYLNLIICINLFFAGTGPVIERISIFNLVALIIFYILGVCFIAGIFNKAMKYGDFKYDLPHKAVHISFTKHILLLVSGVVLLLLSLAETIWNFMSYGSWLHILAIAIFSTYGTLSLMFSFYYSVDKKIENNLTTEENDKYEDTKVGDSSIGKRKRFTIAIFLIGITVIVISGLIQFFYTNNKKEGIVIIVIAIFIIVNMWFIRKKFIS